MDCSSSTQSINIIKPLEKDSSASTLASPPARTPCARGSMGGLVAGSSAQAEHASAQYGKLIHTIDGNTKHSAVRLRTAGWLPYHDVRSADIQHLP
eukprot:2517611-Rhodomonas_salina.1